jgi:hypothetical protein
MCFQCAIQLKEEGAEGVFHVRSHHLQDRIRAQVGDIERRFVGFNHPISERIFKGIVAASHRLRERIAHLEGPQTLKITRSEVLDRIGLYLSESHPAASLPPSIAFDAPKVHSPTPLLICRKIVIVSISVRARGYRSHIGCVVWFRFRLLVCC